MPEISARRKRCDVTGKAGSAIFSPQIAKDYVGFRERSGEGPKADPKIGRERRGVLKERLGIYLGGKLWGSAIWGPEVRWRGPPQESTATGPTTRGFGRSSVPAAPLDAAPQRQILAVAPTSKFEL